MYRHEVGDADNDNEAIAKAERIRRVIPYPLLKGKCGRPKTSNTEGYACLNPACDYRRITVYIAPNYHVLPILPPNS